MKILVQNIKTIGELTTLDVYLDGTPYDVTINSFHLEFEKPLIEYCKVVINNVEVDPNSLIVSEREWIHNILGIFESGRYKGESTLMLEATRHGDCYSFEWMD